MAKRSSSVNTKLKKGVVYGKTPALPVRPFPKVGGVNSSGKFTTKFK